MNTSSSWKLAYRMARLGNLMTLHRGFSASLASAAIDAQSFSRCEQVLPARRFKALGYYAMGKRFA